MLLVGLVASETSEEQAPAGQFEGRPHYPGADQSRPMIKSSAAEFSREAEEEGGGVEAPPTFSQRLRTLLSEKKLSAADLARLLQAKIPGFGAGNVSHYLCDRSFPRPPILKAISEILDADLSDFGDKAYARLPGRRGRTADGAPLQSELKVSALQLTDAGDGNALLQINQKLPWPVALKIIQAIRGTE